MKELTVSGSSSLAGRGVGHPTPPHLEPIVPNLGNRLKTKPFTCYMGQKRR
jgi:hypothetical protein